MTQPAIFRSVLVSSSSNQVSQWQDDATEEEKTAIEKARDELKEALKGSDKAEIEAKTKALTDASAKMAERLYAKKGQAGASPEEAAAQAAASGGDESASHLINNLGIDSNHLIYYQKLSLAEMNARVQELTALNRCLTLSQQDPRRRKPSPTPALA